MNKDQKKLLDEVLTRGVSLQHLANAVNDLTQKTPAGSAEERQNYVSAMRNVYQALSLSADLISKLAVIVRGHEELLALQANRHLKIPK